MHISEKQIDVRYAETDQMGVVYHANYIIWMEVGRTQLIQDLGFDYTEMEKEGYIVPVIDLSVQYKKPARYGDTVTVRTWVEEHGRLRTTYGYEVVLPDGELAATGTTEHVMLNDKGRPVSLKRHFPKWHAKYEEVKKQ